METCDEDIDSYIFFYLQQQYILCHNLVADYLDGFDTYANFKELVW